MSRYQKYAVLLALAALPLIDLGLLINIGRSFGFWTLLALVVLTAAAGLLIIRQVGLSVFTKVLTRRNDPVGGFEPLFDGFLQVLAGICLVLPGPIADVAGLLLLVPPIRHKLISSGIVKLVRLYDLQAEANREAFVREARQNAADGGGVTIEGEYERVSEKTIPPERAVEPRKASGRG